MYLFIFLCSLYLLSSKLHVKTYILIASLGVLMYTVTKKPYQIEKFADPDYSLLSMEEDIKPIIRNLVVYLTAFNSDSYKKGKTWKNLIKKSSTTKCMSDQEFTFENTPVYSRQTGYYLGSNRLVGPYSNNIGIQFLDTFTIVLACKHKTLDTSSAEIELFKLYANSADNNGLSLFIQNGSITNTASVQTGRLCLKYADQDPIICRRSSNSDVIQFDMSAVSYYFVVKGTDVLKLIYMDSSSSTLHTIATLTLSNTDVTFSNKEMVINRLMNWNANIYMFAVYETALPDVDITNVYNHMNNEYQKNIDVHFTDMVSNYNDILTKLNALKACPYDEKVCTNCSSVTDWTDLSQIVSANNVCLKSINDFCALNADKHPFCQCWKTSSADYNSDRCKLLRSLFSDKNALLDSLNMNDLSFIRNKYGFITSEDCPKQSSLSEYKENRFNTYDFNKLRVNLDNAPNTTVVKPHAISSDTDYNSAISRLDRIKKIEEAKKSNLPPVVESETSNKTCSESGGFYAPLGTANPLDVQPDTFFNKFMKVMLPST